MTDKMREEFETAVALEAKEPVLAVYLSRRGDTYSTSTLHFAWWAWKASREALVIELPASPYMPDSEPESMTGYEIGEAQGRCDMWASVREAIESAGLKVTP